MSLTSQTRTVDLTASGGQTSFAFGFIVFETEDLVVLKNKAIQTHITDYTITGLGVDTGGTVEFNLGLTAGDRVEILRVTVPQNPTTLEEGGPFPAATVEDQIDHNTAATIDLNAQFDRTLRLPITSESIVTELPDPLVADAFVAVNNTADGFRYTALPTSFPTAPTRIFDVKNFGAVGDGVTDDAAAIMSAAAGAEAGWVRFPVGTYKISSSFSLNNVFLEPGARLSVDAAQSLTVDGVVFADRDDHIFQGAGTYVLPLQTPVYPEWFGAVRDGATDDSAAITAAHTAANGRVVFQPGVYRITSAVTVNGPTFLRGAVIEVNTGITLTVGDEIKADRYTQIFQGAGDYLIADQRPVYPEWWGAVPDNVTDSRDAIQKALESMPANVHVHFSEGNYVLNTGVIREAPGIMFTGEGIDQTKIRSNNATAVDVTLVSDINITVKDMQFTPLVTKTAGTGLYLSATDPGGFGNRHRLENVSFANQWRACLMDQSNVAVVENCNFAASINVGLEIDHVTDPDSGEITIHGCVFGQDGTNAIALLGRGYGGYKINNNKFQGGDRHIDFLLPDGIGTGVVVIDGNSIEKSNLSGIRLGIDGGYTTGTLVETIISDNEFNNHSGDAITIVDTGMSTWTDVLICNNVIRCPFGGTGIRVNGGENVVLQDNILSTDAGATAGITIAATAISGRDINNTFRGNFIDDVINGASSVFIPDTVELRAGTTYDPPSIAAGATVSTTVAVTGALTTDTVRWAFSTMVAGLVATAWVSAANTVTFQLYNSTGGAIDPANGNLIIYVDHFRV